MAASVSAQPIALVGAPDSHADSKDARSSALQAMHVEITTDIVQELLKSLNSGKAPQIVFGRTPQLKYGDKTHVLQASPETHPYEVYTASGAGSNGELEFAGLINHSLTVQPAEDVTAGVDSALEQLRSSMAAMAEIKEANKTIVDTAATGRVAGHRRFPSAGFNKAQHLTPSKTGSPLLSGPSSPMHKQRAPTSQPNSTRDLVLKALRVPVIHLLAREPATEASLANMCRTSLTSIRDLLPKLAKRSSSATDKWQLIDKSYRELDPWKFPYQSSEDRQQATDNAIKAFDRQRLIKEDKLWQILLPVAERGQGICLSRVKVKALEAKPKASTPMHKISDLTKKKPAEKKPAEKKPAEKKPAEKKSTEKKLVVKKAEDKTVEKKPKAVKEPEFKPKSIKEKYLAREKAKEAKEVKDEPQKTTIPSTATSSTTRSVQPSSHNPSPTDIAKDRPKKAPSIESNSSPRRPKTAARDVHRDRVVRPVKHTMPVNTKPKNPSPLSASPPLNASDFEDNHPVHKTLPVARSPKQPSSGNSDRLLKRKANDIDSDIHNHNLSAKKPRLDRSTPNHTPSYISSRLNGSTPSSSSSLKRKSDESSSSNTPTASKARKVTNIDTGLASRYHHNNPQASPGASSSSTTSPSMPSLSFRQTVELSQKFQKYYKKYEELYRQLTESEKAPTDAQRNDLLNMHKKLEEMKREIKAGAGMHR